MSVTRPVPTLSLRQRLVSREAFMGLFIASVGGIATLLFGIPIVGYVLQPLIQQPKDVWRDIGAADAIPVGQTVRRNFRYPEDATALWAGKTQETSAWVQRQSQNTFIAYAVYCTHLGCPVQWFQSAHLFLCPCHGSVFNSNGTVAGGPAPRPLFRYETRVVNGRLQIKTQAQPLTT